MFAKRFGKKELERLGTLGILGSPDHCLFEKEIKGTVKNCKPFPHLKNGNCERGLSWRLLWKRMDN